MIYNNCTLEDIQQKQCEILKELERVCKKHNIKYYLAQGTLLGAVRNGGFIPWDDDIDVIIPFEELERLMKIFPIEAKKNYFLTNHTVEKYHPLTWSKIRADNTLSRPVHYKDIPVHWGICIDLFPIYPVSNFKALRNFEIFFFKVSRKMLMAEMTKYESGHGSFVRLLEKVPVCVRHAFLNMSLKLFAMHKGKNTKYVYLVCKGGKLMERSVIFGEEKRLNFDGDDYRVPSDYDKFLTEMFGDYMTPPPEEERGGHDLRMGDIEWSIDEQIDEKGKELSYGK